MFKIEEREGKGMAMIATVDLLPGTELFFEKEGLLYIPKHSFDLAKDDEIQMGLSASQEFSKLTSEQQKRFLKLYSPPCGMYRDLFGLMGKLGLREFPPMTPEQLEVASIFTCNSFPTEDGGRAAFEIASRMNHSCYPNCNVNFPNRSCFAMILRPVKAGEEITVEYNRQYRFKGTAERRRHYQNTRDFTCHCERCDAPVDEMRQFSCFDRTCPGRHYTCQSVSDKPLKTKSSKYIGVTFEPPRLLPCTSCHRTPPADYQTFMFAAEQRAIQMFPELQNAFDVYKPSDIPTLKALMRKADSLLSVLPWHGLSIAIRDFHYDWFDKVSTVFMVDRNVMTYEELLRAEDHVRQQRRVMDSLTLLHPCETIARSMFCTAHVLLVSKDKRDHMKARDLTLQGMRVHKVLVGRKYNALQAGGELEDLLCATTTAGHLGHTERCAWCEEIPAVAAMKLSLCGRCRKVAYCSEQCQKAHWKGHKKFCKKG